MRNNDGMRRTNTSHGAWSAPDAKPISFRRFVVSAPGKLGGKGWSSSSTSEATKRAHPEFGAVAMVIERGRARGTWRIKFSKLMAFGEHEACQSSRNVNATEDSHNGARRSCHVTAESSILFKS